MPTGFSSFTNVSISLPSISKTLITTFEDCGMEYLIFVEGLKGLGKLLLKLKLVGISSNLFSSINETPPFVVRRIVPSSPTTVPLFASVKETPRRS